MENGQDKLEELFRKSLEKLSIGALTSWEEELRILELRKRAEGRWRRLQTLSFITMLVTTGVFVPLLPDAPGKADPVAPVLSQAGERQGKEAVPAPVRRSGSPEGNTRPEGTEPCHRAGIPPVSLTGPAGKSGRTTEDTHPAAPVAAVEAYLPPAGGEPRLTGIEATKKGTGDPELPGPPGFEAEAVREAVVPDDPAAPGIPGEPGAAAAPGRRWWRPAAVSLMLGADNFRLPVYAEDVQSSVSSSRVFRPSVGVSGIWDLAPGVWIRPGIQWHPYREHMEAGRSETLVDTMYVVKRKAGDTISTGLAREVALTGRQQFDNSHTYLKLPFSLGYEWQAGRGLLSAYAGFSAGISLTRRAIASAGHELTDKTVADYDNQMDPGPDGYVHYKEYREYSYGFLPVRSELRPLLLQVELGVLGRWPVAKHLDLAAELSYARGMTPVFRDGNGPPRGIAGIRMGVIYRIK